MKPRRTLLESLDECPPFLVYALARTGKRGKRTVRKGGWDPSKRPRIEVLVERSGLSYRTFTRIAFRLSWAKVTAENIDKFCRGCGMNMMNMARQYHYLWYLKKHSGEHRLFTHLNKRQLRTFVRMSARWRELRKLEQAA